MASDSGPDWVVIGGSLATVLTVVAGLVAGMNGAFKTKRSDRQQRQDKRDSDATANASLTLESVFRLVNELQEEVSRKSAEITRIERDGQETRSTLLVRVGELERETRKLEAEIHTLEAEIRTLKRGQQ